MQIAERINPPASAEASRRTQITSRLWPSRLLMYGMLARGASGSSRPSSRSTYSSPRLPSPAPAQRDPSPAPHRRHRVPGRGRRRHGGGLNAPSITRSGLGTGWRLHPTGRRTFGGVGKAALRSPGVLLRRTVPRDAAMTFEARLDEAIRSWSGILGPGQIARQGPEIDTANRATFGHPLRIVASLAPANAFISTAPGEGKETAQGAEPGRGFLGTDARRCHSVP
jgi:hypothetical protein